MKAERERESYILSREAEGEATLCAVTSPNITLTASYMHYSRSSLLQMFDLGKHRL